MKFSEMFGEACWVCAGKYTDKPSKADGGGLPHFPVLRRKFNYCGGRVTLRCVGLGFFTCYMNAKRVSEDLFLPLSTDYEVRNNYPMGEKLHGHRLYVPEYDVTDMLKNGENLLAIHFGGGWYTFESYPYGDCKAVYSIEIDKDGKKEYLYSSENDLIADSFVETYYFTGFENQNYLRGDEKVYGFEYDDTECAKAVKAEPLDTEYLFSDCPADRITEILTPTAVYKADGECCYDAGKNVSGVPRILLHAKKGEKVTVRFSEEMLYEDEKCERKKCVQMFSVVSDGKERVVYPRFTWFGFRYMTVYGNAEPVSVDVIHSDVEVTSSFESDSEVLNWLYKAYINTQLCNMHAGIPSDCPHIERRGYTGDGQLCSHAAMDMLDAKEFYRKWTEDISDCQDDISGHVQYTAPYIESGGGPGGWGCAVVEVPYRFYRHYGDTEPARKLYPQMLRYFDYLDSHSENGLIVSDKKGAWCLGDWCTPTPVALPAAFVNCCFYIRSLMRMCELAAVLGKENDIPAFENKIESLKKAVTGAYYNTWDHNFMASIQGANAFALDAGLGDSRTYENMVSYYEKLGHFDTGIFGTEVLTRTLFERGNGELALRLLMSEDTWSFAEMKKRGATSIWEYWPDATRERSHSHPMFGASAAFLFDYVAGIRETSAAGKSIKISPCALGVLKKVHAQRVLESGRVTVDIVSDENKSVITVEIPSGTDAEFVYKDYSEKLTAGKNEITLEI